MPLLKEEVAICQSFSLFKNCLEKETVSVMSGSDALYFGLVICSRKMRLKRVVRVPAISLKMADIPPDDYSWRKYGQKPIKGSPHPRCIEQHSIV